MEAIHWTGPHEVIEVTNGGLTYTVMEDGRPVKLHVGQLKQYIDGSRMGAHKKSSELEVDAEKEEGEVPPGEYEVGEILSRHLHTRRSKVKPTEARYLVRWKGYTAEEDTLENIKNLMGCARKVAEFWRAHPRLHLDDATPMELDVIMVGEQELKGDVEAPSHEGVASK